jgi:hypothetical protein
MTGTALEWKNWLKAWDDLERQSQITLEQAAIVKPVIQNKILELEALEKQNGE